MQADGYQDENPLAGHLRMTLAARRPGENPVSSKRKQPHKDLGLLERERSCADRRRETGSRRASVEVDLGTRQGQRGTPWHSQVPKQSVGSIQGESKCVCDLKDGCKRRMFPRTGEIGEKVLNEQLSSLVSPLSTFIKGTDSAKEITKMR